MSEIVLQKKARANISTEVLLQLVASLSWVVSVVVYGSYQLGDCLQLLAASAWTVSNIMSCFSKSND